MRQGGEHHGWMAFRLFRNPCQFRADSFRAQCLSCLSLTQTSCPALPSRCLTAFIVGPLGLGSPRFRSGLPPAPAVLCVATTAFVLPGRSACRCLPVPWFNALLFVFLPALAGLGSSDRRVAHRMPGCWLGRSPCRPLLPRRREALPSSRITPLNTCPALRLRWCPARWP
jgi:hypothetical protein